MSCIYTEAPCNRNSVSNKAIKLRLGIDDKPEKFKVIAASASLESAADDNSFLSEFLARRKVF